MGIEIDETFWMLQIDATQTEIRRNLRTFYFLRILIGTDLLKTNYFSLIHSRLIYGTLGY